MTDVIAWSIGLIPVQEWIAEARRSRDLKIGSAMLSWFMAVALKELTGNGAALFVPALTPNEVDAIAEQKPPDLLESKYGIPNRASGWTTQSLDEAAKTLGGLQGIISRKWEDFGRAVSPTVRPAMIQSYLPSAMNPVRVVWCARPVPAAKSSELAPGEKIAGLRAIEQLYASVKRTRPIVSYRGEPIGKCGQCAKRDAIGPADWKSWRQYQEKFDNMAEIRKARRLDSGERLCSVCLLKRFAGYLSNQPFPSTSEIASREWLFRVEKFEDLENLVKAWRRQAAAIDKDDPHPFLYERTIERFRKAAEADADAEDQEKARNVSDAVQVLTENLEQKHPDLPRRPSQYLAVITFDGDNMGKTVQGDPERIPPALMRFAKTLESDIEGEAYKATAFYLGGDEGLLLCPIETCLALVNHINESFAKVMPEKVGDVPKPTISVGVAIFDRERPLAAAIKSARDALGIAKEMDKKNALCVSVSTASGNTWSTVDHWGDGWDRVDAAVKAVSARRLSSGWAYDVESLLETLPASYYDREGAREALQQEVRRITARRTKRSGDSVWDELRGPQWWAVAPDPTQREQLANQLHLIAFLARQSQSSVGESVEPSTESEVAQ